MKRFILYLVLIAVVLSVAIESAGRFISMSTETYLWIHFSNVFYFVLTLIFYFLTKVGLKTKSNKIFVKTIGTIIFLRLLFSLLLVAIALISSTVDRKQFVVGIIILYFTYMAFEIRNLALNLRLDSESYQNDGKEH